MKKLKYLLLILPFIFISNVKGAMVGDYSFLGHKLDDEFVVLSSSPLTGSIYFYNTIEGSSTSSSNFFYVDLCTNGAEPTLWITSNTFGTMAPSTKWYRVNQSCNVNGETAKVYRQIIFISSSYQGSACSVDGLTLKCSLNESQASLFSNTYYNVYMRILHMGIAEDIPLNDLILDEQTTQTSILNDILSSIKSDSSINQQIKENTEKQLEEQKKQLDEQKKTNETLKDDNIDKAQDSAGGFFNDFTTDTHGLTAIVTAPLSLISSITSSACTPLIIPLPYVDKDLTLPCMGTIYSNYFGSFLSIYQMITFGIIAYWVCVRIFNLVKDFKNPDHDEIEVFDL